ncbi:mitochondrial inner membrane protease subunit 1 isoform X2 [Orussus abietinus]|uniref:mitochondrial inner membrane protease subunit 1 isoform X2 n=1 Tax=Orussus abietinus TaxID=222816 RepID=UPI00062620B2|nr:mitochondrial inner membrane protease subunit 1 isoform X2 [Orussus abietinus]
MRGTLHQRVYWRLCCDNQCTGPSMEPTIRSNDILLTEHISTQFQTINKGDIIITKCPTNPREHICKRVIALPGDKVRYDIVTHIVPLGHVWVEGDNKDNSSDSRSYGPIPQGLIRGRAVCRVWPFTNIAFPAK